jgi:putative membrane protein
MMGYDGFGWLFGGGYMMLMMAFVWIVPIALIVWAVTGLGRGQSASPRQETPIEILRRRYASGEISQEEFEQVARALG